MSETIIDKLQKPLNVEDIEFRIGNVQKVYQQGKLPKGFSLLAYKTARTDVKRLNDAVGINWRNSYFYDNKGILCCTISVYNEDTNSWVDRTDVGTESNTEKEKGSYSDAFKRAGFKWGIGSELYNMPFIWINWNEYNEHNGKFTPKNFDANSIKVTNYEVKNGDVLVLTLEYKGNLVYKQQTVSIDKVIELADVKGIATVKICEAYKIETLQHATSQELNTIYNQLLKK
jgi:hypothetical protein